MVQGDSKRLSEKNETRTQWDPSITQDMTEILVVWCDAKSLERLRNDIVGPLLERLRLADALHPFARVRELHVVALIPQ